MMLRRLKEDVDQNIAAKEETIVEVLIVMVYFFLSKLITLA